MFIIKFIKNRTKFYPFVWISESYLISFFLSFFFTFLKPYLNFNNI